MKFITRNLLLLALIVPVGLVASPSTEIVYNEVSALLQALGTSQCEFFRNGSWYDSEKAESHLQRKLDYVKRKDLLSSVDAFVDQAASRSSMTGKPYLVRCPGHEAQPSTDWFKQKLGELRARGAVSPH